MRKLRRRLQRPVAAGLLVLLVLCGGLAACTSVRPVEKIGVIGSFEGLYRRTGYTALEAARSALVDTDSSVDLIPLALDDSGDMGRAERAAAKLSLDGNLAVVIGPYLPATIAGVARGLGEDIDWIVPFAVDPAGGFAHPSDTSTWLTFLVSEVAHAASAQGRTRLALAGWPDLPLEAGIDYGLPVAAITEPNGVEAGDALLWLGDPAGAARFLTTLRDEGGTNPFWLAPWGYDPIFVEYAPPSKDVFWIIWSDLSYNDRVPTHSPSTAHAHLTYVATREAVTRLTDAGTVKAPKWQVQWYEIDANGEPTPLQLD